MRFKFKWIYAIIIVLSSIQFSFAQERTISGVVSDNSGVVPGVNIVVKGTKTSTQTDFDGRYSINAKTGDVLVFSYVGMEDRQVSVGASDNLNVTMQSSAKSLDEVVVVAYGTQKTKAIVGAITTIGSEVLQKQQATSVLSALQGSVAGVSVISAGGQPGENPVIRVRGTGSINASNEPLIVLDGAPFGGNLNSISADQIETMSVLKDASSTALYGSRGANGVILITTKRGKLNSAPRVTISSQVGFASNAVKLHDLLSSDDYMRYTWEAIKNTNQYVGLQDPATAGQNASGALVSRLGYNPYTVAQPVDANGNLVTTNKKWDTNWEDLLLNDAAVRKEHTFSFSGGSENTRYFFTSNYLSQEGSIKTSKFDRITTRLSVDSKINEWLKAGVTMFYSTSDQNFPTQSGSSFQNAIQWIYTIPSIYPVYRRDANGDLVFDARGNTIYDYGSGAAGQLLNATRPQLSTENALGALYNYKIGYKRDNYTANAYLDFTLAKGLTFRTNLAYDKYLYDNFEYSSNEFGNAASVGGRVTQNRDITTSVNFINGLNYKKSFGDHNFSADLIQETYQFKIDAMGAQGEGFLPGVEVLSGSTTPTSVSGSVSEERISSYLGRLAYNYKEKYFLEGSYRRDGSSRFNSDVRWGNFYSVGGSWLVSEESFLKDNTVLSELKLRGSYGELGNNKTLFNGSSDYFPALQSYETGWNELENTGVVLGRAVDQYLTWETTALADFGLDFGLFNNRITGTVDYYNKKSVDLINDKPTPGSIGGTVLTTNIGSLKNYGWEFSLSTKNIQTPNFTWNTGLNFSFDKNKVTEQTQEGIIVGTKRYEVGRSLFEFYIQDWAGVDPATGYGMWYKDILGADGKPTGERETTKTYAQATRYYVDKSSLPDVVGGFTNFFKYKNIDLNILFNFSLGSYVYDSSYASLMEGFKSPGRAGSQDLENRWQNPGDVTDVPLLLASNNDFNSQSTRFLFKNDYVRLKALNFGYNFPQSVLDKTKLSRLRLYFQGDNLWTYQSHEGIDPEQNFGGTTDNRSYNLRVVSFGLNLEF